jgi:hypothetical protein
MFYGRDEVVLLLVTYAVFLILEDVTKLIWGVNPIYATQPYELFGNVEVAGLYYVGYDLVLIPISAAVGLLVGSFSAYHHRQDRAGVILAGKKPRMGVRSQPGLRGRRWIAPRSLACAGAPKISCSRFSRMSSSLPLW